MPHIEPHGGLQRATLLVAILLTGLSLLIAFAMSPHGMMVASAAGISIVDDGGANDAVGQNDLTRLTGDDPASTGFFNVQWS